MKFGQALLMFALAAPAVALSQDAGKYQCTHGDLVRRVEIFTEPGVTVPCEVHYFKDTEAPGASEVLWSAQSQDGYCEEKATEFIARLEGWGWDCGVGAASEPAAEPAPSADPAPAAEPDEPAEPEMEDDTDVLSPGDPSGG